MIKILITICARGGSKGVSNKNIRPLRGRPLIDYSIICADAFRRKYTGNIFTNEDIAGKDFACSLSADIAINSDSDEILARAGCFTDVMSVKRPDELAQDSSPKIPAIQHAVSECEKMREITYDFVIDLDATSPLRQVEDIYGIFDKCAFSEHNYDVVFSAVPARRNPYFNMAEIRGGYAYRVKESSFSRRQDAPPVYDMNASVYCYKRGPLDSVFRQFTFDGKCGLYEMEDTHVIDIDNESDFIILELLIEHYYHKKYPHLFVHKQFDGRAAVKYNS